FFLLSLLVLYSSLGSIFSETLFFFYQYGDHQDLHSFPTRRSSDLAGIRGPGLKVALMLRFHHRNIYPDRNLYRVHHAHLIGISQDRKSTRLNSSHVKISYAVFCLKKKILMIIT